MQIHEVVDNTTLEIVLNAVDDDLLANVHQLQVGVAVLIAVGVNSLVDFFIVLDAIAKVLGRFFWILAAVVGACQLDVTNVGHDGLFIIAFAFDKQHLDAMGSARIPDPFASLLGGIGRIQDANDAAGAEPGKHVSNGGLGSGTAFPLTLGVAEIEKVGRGLWSVMTPVVADIEGCRRNRQPLQISLG